MAEYDIAVEWRGVEIHPEIPPEGLTLPPETRARFGGMSDKLREEAEAGNLPIVVLDKVPKSRRALEASEYAREQGQHEPFHKVVFRKFYGEGQNLSSWDVLRAAAEEVGLDAAEMQQKTENRDYAKIINQRMNEIFTLGATGVPRRAKAPVTAFWAWAEAAPAARGVAFTTSGPGAVNLGRFWLAAVLAPDTLRLNASLSSAGFPERPRRGQGSPANAWLDLAAGCLDGMPQKRAR